MSDEYQPTEADLQDAEKDANRGILSGGGAPSGAPVRTVDLGTSIIVYYGDGSHQVLPKSQFPSKSNGGIGGSGPAPEHLGAAQIGAQTAANSLAEQIRQHQASLGQNQNQYQSTLDFERAKYNTDAQLRQGEALGYYNGQNTLARDQLNQGNRQFNSKQALDYYQKLSELASNPRNFIQNFFQTRGQVAPAGSDKYGNVNALQRYLPEFLRNAEPGGAGASSSAPAAPGAPAPAAFAPPPAPVAAPPAANPSYNTTTGPQTASGAPGAYTLPGANGVQFTQPNPNVTPKDYQFNSGYKQLQPNPNTPVYDREGRVISGGIGNDIGQAGTLAANTPAADDHLRKLGGFAGYQAYRKGGVIPEPVVGVGVHSGQKYMFGENGPEGVVPAEYLPKFLAGRHGEQVDGSNAYAAGGEIGYTNPDDPYPVNPNDPYAGTTPPISPTIPAESGLGVPPVTTEVTPQVPLAATPAPTTDVSNNPFSQIPFDPATPAVSTQRPLELPQASNNNNATPQTPGLLTAAQVAPPGTFAGGTTPGQTPNFLPGEDQSSVLNSLLAQGVLPPFLARLFGQNHGVDSVGTNKPQRYDLPSDVPLVSKLAFRQMTPSEQQALLSYVSAYGVTPEDYLGAIEQYAPQGPETRLPNFGTPFAFQRQ